MAPAVRVRTRPLHAARPRTHWPHAPRARNGQITDVIRLRAYLNAHGTAAGLDLSQADLSGACLDGLDLTGAKFGDADRRRGANLTNASLEHAVLNDACLAFANLTGAKLRRASLCGAELIHATLDRVDMRRAELQGADLYKASLADVQLRGANLAGASLYLAELDGVHLGIPELQLPLLEDRPAEFRAFQRCVPLEDRRIRLCAVYAALKNNWRELGYNREAGWAFTQEQRVRRSMHAPGRAARYFPAPAPAGGRVKRWLRGLAFHVEHTALWLCSGLVDALCAYGESPLRATLTMLAVLLLFPWLYWLSGGVVVTAYSTPLDYLIYSIGAFTSMGFANLQAINWQAQLLTGVEALLGIALFALLIFTLTNRTNRL